MMPSSEVRISKSFKGDFGTTTIQAGEKGWTILYPDHSSQFKDENDTVENNFNKALKILKQQNEKNNPL